MMIFRELFWTLAAEVSGISQKKFSVLNSFPNLFRKMDAFFGFCPWYVAAQIEFLLEAAVMAQLQTRALQNPMDRYLLEFLSRTEHLRLSDVVDYRNYVIKKGPFINDSVAPDLPKDDRKAAAVRQVGNRLYLEMDYPAALEKYNESICWAKGPNSEHLGIGYANRSAIYFDMGEYELSLANIDLAKKHNYPQRLMPKLVARELNCKHKIEGGQSKRAKPCAKLDINVEVNPLRPFMAAGIVQKMIPGYGRSVVAERNFKPGDVILNEKAMLTAISPEVKYKNCNHCSMENFHSLIPCPKCVSVMFCSKECLEKGLRYSHRFECGITEKLHHFSQEASRVLLGIKAFFYGLTLFNDNLKDMMSFCKRNDRTGADPFTLDYSNYDPLEEFKIFHMTKLPTDEFKHEDAFRFYASVYYSIYIRQPLVRSMFTTKAQKDFFLRSILDYTRIMRFLLIEFHTNLTSQFFSIASVCNHSCDPNTAVVNYFGKLKLIAIRPIAIDEQILVSYGLHSREHSYDERQVACRKIMHFKCLCDACDERKMRRIRAAAGNLPAVPNHHIVNLKKVYDDPAINGADKLNMMRQFIGRYVYAYPRYEYVTALDVYRELLDSTFKEEMEDQLRATASEVA
ncbi:AAEL011838-PA [Aedes aegypti]|uniref:AAEL011838-PA n=1 Tax=Aedes aegypti TaxID=7159 RepID=Q16NW3_AEDAE|nr:AAEL011838-PA [Aedes aegypti]